MLLHISFFQVTGFENMIFHWGNDALQLFLPTALKTKCSNLKGYYLWKNLNYEVSFSGTNSMGG